MTNKQISDPKNFFFESKIVNRARGSTDATFLDVLKAKININWEASCVATKNTFNNPKMAISEGLKVACELTKTNIEQVARYSALSVVCVRLIDFVYSKGYKSYEWTFQNILKTIFELYLEIVMAFGIGLGLLFLSILINYLFGPVGAFILACILFGVGAIGMLKIGLKVVVILLRALKYLGSCLSSITKWINSKIEACKNFIVDTVKVINQKIDSCCKAIKSGINYVVEKASSAVKRLTSWICSWW